MKTIYTIVLFCAIPCTAFSQCESGQPQLYAVNAYTTSTIGNGNLIFRGRFRADAPRQPLRRAARGVRGIFGRLFGGCE